METDWVENRADIPQDGVRAILKKYLDMLYSAPTRDRFRTRLERSADGKNTEVYLTHSGVEEVAVGGASASSTNTYIWQRRPPDPELEAEMLNRLTVYLGASEKRAEVQQAKTGAAPAGPRVAPGRGGRREPVDRQRRLFPRLAAGGIGAGQQQLRGRRAESRPGSVRGRVPRSRTGKPEAGRRRVVVQTGVLAQQAGSAAAGHPLSGPVVRVRAHRRWWWCATPATSPTVRQARKQVLEALQKVIK